MNDIAALVIALVAGATLAVLGESFRRDLAARTRLTRHYIGNSSRATTTIYGMLFLGIVLMVSAVVQFIAGRY